jgi:hypothetical protein
MSLAGSLMGRSRSPTWAWPNIGLPDNYLALIAPPLRAFIGEGKRTVAHGGICIEETIVPVITVTRFV